MPQNTIDFTFGSYKRSSLYLKRSMGAPIPKDCEWICPCGSKIPLNEEQEQHCPKCGTRLRLQIQKEDGYPNPQGLHRYTLVRVAHYSVVPETPQEEKKA